MKVLIIDNYDSFTYNLVHLIECFTDDYEVWRNDEIDFNRVMMFDRILLSPGPGLPNEAGQMPELIKRFVKSKPILGICLGCQALGEYFGAELFNMQTVKHGLQTPIFIVHNSYLYKGIASEIEVGRYHSWALDINKVKILIPTAYDIDGVLMSFRHSELPIYGIQFHPESIMTPEGKRLIDNWMNNV
jgi:anthranilate synthase component 2